MSAAADNQAVYRERLQTLQKIRARANGKLKLAQICVLGDQSSGKSSLLAACTGIAFPESAGICTRAPIVVECQYDNALQADEYRIEAPTGLYERCQDLTDLKVRIARTQEAALKKLQEVTLLLGLQSSISTDEIRVKVRGPNQMDIIVIDLPGIIHNGEGADETRQLIRRYCEPQQTLMLLVSEAKQDEESIEAIALAKSYDKEGVRTLRVLTKFDMFDSNTARERACGWVEDGGQSCLGCHAVVCRSHGGDHNSREEARCLTGLPGSHSGVAALKQRLPPLFAELISHSLPDLQKQIMQKLQEAQEGLRVVGAEPVNRSMMLYNFQRVVDDSESFEKALALHVGKFQQSIRRTEKSVTKEWTDAKFSPNPFRLTHFQGEAAVMACMEEIVDTWWREPLEAFHTHICGVSENSLSVRTERRKQGLASTLSRSFLETVEAEWLVFCQGHLNLQFSEELKGVLERERGFGTINHYLDSKYEELTVLPDTLIKNVARHISEVMRGYDTTNQQNKRKAAECLNEASVEELLKKQRTAWVAEYEKLDLQDQQKHRIFNAVKALWSVEAKTFVDNVLKVTRDSVLPRAAPSKGHSAGSGEG